ncbi:MAG: amidohydrolase family protein [Myxococcota bacterium]
MVFTGRSLVPDATWFVVRGGRVADVGDGLVPDRWKDAARVDLGGRFVTPGFVDAHVHFVDGGLSLLEADASSAAAARPRWPTSSGARRRRRSARRRLGRRPQPRPRRALGGDAPTHARMAASPRWLATTRCSCC